jgi:arylsulfatase
MNATRKTCMGKAILSVLLLCTISCAIHSLKAADSRPNIIIILSDDMGFSDIGCYGSEINTPTLDSLAKNGLRFAQFYNTARCCPTRASLITGLYPHQANVGHMTGRNTNAPEPYAGDLSRKAVTIAEALKPAGYGTYMVGKWHVTSHDEAKADNHNWPLQRGFDKFYGTIKGGGSFYDPTSLTRGNTFITPENDAEYRPKSFYYTDALSDNATKFIQEHVKEKAGAPFFMYLAYTAAHWPMHAPEEAIAKYRGKYDSGYAPIRQRRFEQAKKLGLINAEWDLSPQAGDWDKVDNKAWEARCMEVYAAMIDRLDEGIGKVVATLKAQNMLDNTLIFFLQDNGGCAENMGRRDDPKHHLTNLKPMLPDDLQPSIWPPMQTRDGRPVLGGPGVMPGAANTYIAYGQAWANVSNTPFREYKHWVHEGGISTPLIAYWPKVIKRHGEIEKQPGHLIDLMATCVDVAQSQYPTEFSGQKITPKEGTSLKPAFVGNKLARQEPIFWEHEGNRAMRDGRWKLVAKSPGGNWELYDMDKDRTEMHDLAADQPARVKEMSTRWETWAKRAGVLPWIWKPAYGGTKEAFAGKNRFELKSGDDLDEASAPDVAQRPFAITAEILQLGDGIILAQGGRTFGHALLVQQGKLKFLVRNNNQLETVESSQPLSSNTKVVSATLAKGGNVTLTANGSVVGTGKVTGLMGKTPVDGLQIGRDGHHEVGDYKGENPFQGKLGKVTMVLE